jgi:hypothetical protein
MMIRNIGKGDRDAFSKLIDPRAWLHAEDDYENI